MYLLSGLLLTSALAGCGATNGTAESGGSPAPSTDGGKAPAETAASQEPVKLVFFSDAGWSPEAFDERFGNAMRKKFPNYTIEYIKAVKGKTLADMVAAGDQIDVYWQAVDNTIPNMLQYQLQYDMSDLIKKHGIDLSKLEPSSIQAIRDMSDGKMYALPLVNNTAALYYNKDLFDKFGVDYPKDGMTWDDVITLAQKMHRTEGDQSYYGIASSTQPHANLSPLSVPIIDPKTMKSMFLSDDRWKIIMNQLVEMKKTLGDQNIYATEFVKDKNIAMLDALANQFLNVDMTSMNWDMVSYPTDKEAPGVGPQPLPTLFGITATSKHKDEATEVLKYMLSPEVQKDLSERGVIPILQDDAVIKAFATKTKYKDKNFQAIVSKPFAPLAPRTKYEGRARHLYSLIIDDLAAGKTDMNTAFRSVDEQINKLIADDQAK